MSKKNNLAKRKKQYEFDLKREKEAKEKQAKKLQAKKSKMKVPIPLLCGLPTSLFKQVLPAMPLFVKLAPGVSPVSLFTTGYIINRGTEEYSHKEAS
ncbi:uncharacterized protein LOC112880581 isoform X1 [Panicum hallii]|uniref:uncharacterized protein LOC112880581 isoform X1 n=1 Tax=Panicum hallii TaxID=206008 RepID=UPI000DF4EB1A|nr:uncharacterized protein LOC112880581 isoform X1 [Panicum hallii]